MKHIGILYIVFLFFGCSSSSSNETNNNLNGWQGKWNARWETSPEDYQGVQNMKFYMDGEFVFDKKNLSITAYGFPGCIFNTDTLSNTQGWYTSKDTLYLVNSQDSWGINYSIKHQSNNKIRLQMMADIFVTLTR